MNNNLFEVLKSRFPADPSTIFIQSCGRRITTYADMLARSAQYANALVGLGISPGDRVAVQVEKSCEALMLYLGAIRAGAAYLPLNTAYTPAELSFFMDDAEPSLVVCRTVSEEDMRGVSGKAVVETLGDSGEGGSLLAMVDAAPTSFEEVVRGADDLAAILYTSGTTGRAKGAMLSHNNLSSNAKALAETWAFTSQD
jgi:malonyl-CoA/methylmalonyl-CoA synthetase